jgi:hypothetical protein
MKGRKFEIGTLKELCAMTRNSQADGSTTPCICL